MIQILTIPGDGIGQEVTPAAVAVLRATDLPLAFAHADAGWACFQRHGTALPDATLDAARDADAILFGAVASPSHPVAGYRSPIVALRRALTLYANIRPTQGHATDLVIVRENTEGLYAGRERVEDGGDTAITERVITRQASERIVRAAFTLAAHRPQRPALVTIVHKANVLRETCGLFRRVALEVAAGFPDVRHEEMLVDVAAMRLAQSPERFDVVVTTNLFGDILSDVACIHGGGLGLATSANLGERHALFEPVHGAAPDIAGRGVANPLAAIGCAALLLEWLAPRQSPELALACSNAARSISAAAAYIRAHGPHTPDLGGAATTNDITAAVVARVRNTIGIGDTPGGK